MSGSRKTRPGWGQALILAVGSLAWLSVAQADNSGAKSLDAEAFLTRFEAASPHFEAFSAQVDRAAARVESARSLPALGVAYEREHLFPDGGGAAEDTLSVNWTLDLSGARGRRVRSARHGHEAARSRAEQARFTIAMDALEVYYGAARMRLRAAALRDGRAPLLRTLTALSKRVGAGDAAGYDKARLELELLRYDERIAEAQTEERAAAGSLGIMLGDAGTRYVASDPLAAAAVANRPEVLAALQDKAVVHGRAEYRAAAADARSAQSLIEAAGRWWIPLIDLKLGLKTADLGTETATGFVAGLSVQVPIFSRGRAEAKHAGAERRAARARMHILEREIPARIGTARRLLASRAARARDFEAKSVAKADAIVLQSSRIYGAGEGSVVDLLDAYRISLEVRLRSIDLRWKSRLAQLELWRALGRRPALSGASL